MDTSKPLVFISHITEEKEIAVAFKELIESSFLGMLDVFVSSDEDSIRMGQKWLDRISNGLKTCTVEIVLCSPKSILRPWINFEAGAGWVRDIPVIPLCHSGIEPAKLPMPLNLLQAAKANEVSSLKLIFPVLAEAIGAKTPNIDFSDFVAKVDEFEVRYTFWDACNAAFIQINSFNDSIISVLKSGNSFAIALTETEINYLLGLMEFLNKNNILALVRSGGVNVGPGGMTHHCSITPLAEFSRVVRDPHFKF
jgi:TIR domain